MLWLTAGLALLIGAGTIFYVVKPLFAPARPLQEADDSPLGELLARKDAVLLSIKEIEFDYQTGKLNEEDYARYNQRLRLQAVSLIKRIERLAPDMSALEAELEAAIAAQRRSVAALPDAGVATGAAAVDSVADASEVRFCRECGAAVEPHDKFCAACGTPLRIPAQPI